MRIEIWSDVVCPWCYIGKRRLERALAEFPHADEVEIVFRSFELDPSAPRGGTEPVVEVLARKYGGGLENARAMQARVSEIAAAEGLDYHLEDGVRGSTVDAHRLLHLALADRDARLQADLKEALLDAYLVRAEDIGSHDVLRKVASDVGLDTGRVDEVLASEEFLDAVRADEEQARAYGASGVPFVVVDQKYGVSGAQPVEVFTQLLDRAWADAHGRVTLLDGDGDACGPEGCD